MKTIDNKTVIIPNTKLTQNNITNYTGQDTRRVDLTFGIGYSDDIKKARKILKKILEEDDRVLDDPEYQIVVTELGDSSVNIGVRPWVKTQDYWDFYFEMTEKTKLKFDEAGISIPFPQRDIHIHKEQ